MKIFISLSETQTMYRGEGKDSNSNVIEWITPDLKHAQGYANFREGNIREVPVDLDREKVISLSHDSMKVTPKEFVSRVLRQVPRRRIGAQRETLMQAHDKFLEHFNSERRIEMMDYWKSEADKVAVRDLLVAFGFTMIRVQESRFRVETYGRLKK